MGDGMEHIKMLTPAGSSPLVLANWLGDAVPITSRTLSESSETTARVGLSSTLNH